MTKTFTEHDLIRYLYRETSEKEDQEINQALLCDAELVSMLHELSAVRRTIDDAVMEPSPGTVLNILSYARGLQTK